MWWASLFNKYRLYLPNHDICILLSSFSKTGIATAENPILILGEMVEKFVSKLNITLNTEDYNAFVSLFNKENVVNELMKKYLYYYK